MTNKTSFSIHLFAKPFKADFCLEHKWCSFHRLTPLFQPLSVFANCVPNATMTTMSEVVVHCMSRSTALTRTALTIWLWFSAGLPPVSFQHLPPCTLGRRRGVSEREAGENCEGERMWLQSQERRGMCIAQSRLCTFSKVLRKPDDCLCSPFLNPSLSAVIGSEVMYSRSCDGITVKQWVGTVSVFS